jgi:hypothetical protein
VGRVRQITQPVDNGDPGKFYFTEPEVIEIAGKPFTPSTPAAGFPRSSPTIDMNPGRCRLRSSHELHGYTPPNNIVYDMNQWPTQHMVKDYLKRNEIAGFGENSIVTRRFQNKGRWKYQHQWGVIILVCKVPPAATIFAPYIVKWFSGEKTEPAWAEDLVVVHACLTEELLSSIMEDQGIDLEEGA